MDALELISKIEQGETSTVQFKERLENNESIAAEMIAMSNTKGGDIFFGIEDKSGSIIGLDYKEIQHIGNTVANIATDMIKPQIFISTEVVAVGKDNKNILIVHVNEGIAKPYKDKNDCIWVKQGGDKRRLTDNNEILRLFQQCGLIYVDELVIPQSSIDDIDENYINNYLNKLDEQDNSLDKHILYTNMNILKNDKVTLGGLMFFGKQPQRYRPVFCIKAICFYGNDIADTEYRDSEDIDGIIPEMFKKAMSFLKRNLRHIQAGQNFNSTGKLEISEIALEELLQNALTHRDYSINAPIKLLIFDDRVEIVSPGSLPNSLTIENIKLGTAVVRNNLIVSFCSKTMNYRGIGSGIRRAIKEAPKLKLEDDKKRNLFIVTLPRVKE